MPPVIGNCHAEIVLRYLSAGKLNTKKEKLILALHKKGYIVPCNILYRTNPKLRSGLQMIGFIHKVKRSQRICELLDANANIDDLLLLLTDENWLIQAFNLKAARFFGVDPSQADLKKYIHSEEKIIGNKLIPLLDEPGFLNGLRSAGSSEVTLDVTKIRRTVSEEIEIVQKMQEEDKSWDLEAEFPVEKLNDSYLKGMINIVDLRYGSLGSNQGSLLNLKLVVVVIDQLLPKHEVCEISNDLLFSTVPKKKNEIFIDDIASQSQSSTSSYNSTEAEQRNVRSFKEAIKEQHSPFFARCFARLGALVFLAILASFSSCFCECSCCVCAYALDE
eukprot:TRINITY_DN26224_c0_g2_i1.p1 TRINITY_DN26224_c0_g2~~TRINITY_DN26224_c0_g2_i1.p1  ORF type:complete len:387 (-),score=93.72 TRINITY_DN26224_c0_g2_i1:272-1270(-)